MWENTCHLLKIFFFFFFYLDKWAFKSMWHKKKYPHAIQTHSSTPCTKTRPPTALTWAQCRDLGGQQLRVTDAHLCNESAGLAQKKKKKNFTPTRRDTTEQIWNPRVGEFDRSDRPDGRGGRVARPPSQASRVALFIRTGLEAGGRCQITTLISV